MTNQTEILQWIQKSIVSTVDVAKEQLPPLIDEFLRWKLLYHGFLTILWLSMVGICTYILIKRGQVIWSNWKPGVSEFSLDLDINFPILVLMVIFDVFAISLLINQLLNFMQLIVAPNVYLLEYAVRVSSK